MPTNRATGVALATIPDTSDTSEAIDFRTFAGAGVYAPAAFDGTEVSVEVSTGYVADATTFDESDFIWTVLTDSAGVPVPAVPLAAEGSANLPSEVFPWPWFRLVSDVNQSGGCVLEIVRKG